MAVSQGFEIERDVLHIEEHGCIAGADPDVISKRAYERGRPQLGTLGSGNHFVEIDYVEEVFDPQIAALFGLEKIGLPSLSTPDRGGLATRFATIFYRRC